MESRVDCCYLSRAVVVPEDAEVEICSYSVCQIERFLEVKLSHLLLSSVECSIVCKVRLSLLADHIVPYSLLVLCKCYFQQHQSYHRISSLCPPQSSFFEA